MFYTKSKVVADLKKKAVKNARFVNYLQDTIFASVAKNKIE